MSEGQQHRRKWKNLLIAPKEQLRTGAALFFVGFGLMSTLFGVVLSNLSTSLADGTTTLEDARITLWIAYGIFCTGFFCSALYQAVRITHRYLGPMVAIRRQLKAMREGNFSERMKLREGDEFTDVADDLNALAEKLEKTR